MSPRPERHRRRQPRYGRSGQPRIFTVSTEDGQRVGSVRHGSIGNTPVNSAACAGYHGAYDLATADDATLWLVSHLASVHGVRGRLVASEGRSVRWEVAVA